jgi:hypothetical protein
MKYAAEMGSGAMIYIPNFVKINSGIKNLIGGIHRHTDNNNQPTNQLTNAIQLSPP